MKEQQDQSNESEQVPYKPEAEPQQVSSYDPSIAGVLNNGFAIGGTNFFQILGISLAPLLFIIPFALSFFATVYFHNNDYTFAFITGAIVSFVLLVLALYVSILAQAALVSGLITLIRTKQTKLSMSQAWELGKKHVWTFFAASLALALFILLGFVFLIIPGLIIMVLFYFTPYVAIDEEKGIKASFARARALMKGNVGTFLVILLLLFAVAGAASVIPFLSLFMVPFEAALFAYMYVAFAAQTPERSVDNA